MIRYVARIFLVLALAAALAGCRLFGDAAPVRVTVPSDIPAVQAIEPGASLKKYGYTPVSNLYKKDTQIGHVYVACGETRNISKCGSDLHNRGTTTRPNVYIKDGKIAVLEGPHTSDVDDRSYYVTVPETYQDFAALTPEQQQELLETTMSEVINQLGSPDGGTAHTLDLSIGQVRAWVSRSTPTL